MCWLLSNSRHGFAGPWLPGVVLQEAVVSRQSWVRDSLCVDCDRHVQACRLGSGATSVAWDRTCVDVRVRSHVSGGGMFTHIVPCLIDIPKSQRS